MVEYAFREFMCTPIADWKDATRPDDMVGRDVDRFAGGGNSRYQTTCKACHTQLDSFRTAFAYLDFNGGVTYSAPTVAGKLNRNAGTFPSGFVTTNDRFVNNAQGPLIVDKFGWRGTSTGRGMNEFGQMLASSKGFSRCMVRRLFTEICKREASVDEEEIVRSLADRFEGTYKIKDLAEMIAVHPMCLEKRH